jgi:hypothetical protein
MLRQGMSAEGVVRCCFMCGGLREVSWTSRRVVCTDIWKELAACNCRVEQRVKMEAVYSSEIL